MTKARDLADLSQSLSNGSFSSLSFSGWTVSQDGSGNLTFTNGGSVKAKLSSDGALSAADDIAAFESL